MFNQGINILNTCLNGGTCIAQPNSTCLCKCSYGWTGPNCEIPDPCLSMPCKNNGTCYNLNNGAEYGCLCDKKYPGIFCEEESNITTTTTTTTTTTFTSTSSRSSTVTTTTTSTSTSTTTTTRTFCIDYNSLYCEYFASSVYCTFEYYLFGIPMPIFCANSCNSCPTVIPSTTISTSTSSSLIFTTTSAQTSTTSETTSLATTVTTKSTTTEPLTTSTTTTSTTASISTSSSPSTSTTSTTSASTITASTTTTSTLSTTTTTSTQSTTQISPSSCTDYNIAVCTTFGKPEYCNSNVFAGGKPIAESCALSCGRCNQTISTLSTSISTSFPTTTRTTSTPICFDFNPSFCLYFASRGFCSPIFYAMNRPMLESCAVSCNSC
jgi:hypothetical protein